MMTTDPTSWSQPDLGLDRPNVARMYDYLLGGCHNLGVDREAADAVVAAAPEVVTAARANRAFLRRVVRYALHCGIRQFLDLGSGIPTVGNVHEIAHRSDPAAHVVYVDVDAVVVAHAQGLLHATATVGVIQADIRDTDAVLNHPETRGLIDFSEPVAVLAASVLHFVTGDITNIAAAFREPMSPGSLLAVSHASSVATTPQTTEVQQLYQRTATPMQLRTPDEILALFTGLDLVHPDPRSTDPGDRARLVPVTDWRPDGGVQPELSPHAMGSPFLSGFLAGVGCKPTPPSAPRQPPRRTVNRAPVHQQQTRWGTPELARAPR
jgi:S-adenosyl methyltransferase